MEAFVQLDVCVEIRIGWLEWLVKEGARRVVTGVQVVPWLGVFSAHAQKPPQLSSSPLPSTNILLYTCTSLPTSLFRLRSTTSLRYFTFSFR